MTRRERLEAKQAKREEWAEKAETRSAARFDAAHRAVEGIPFGQPVLVGHHSEKRHRAALDRMASNMTKGCEEADLAKRHASKADGLAHQLDRSIFSDDPDAVEALQDRAATLRAQRDEMKAANAWWRKNKTMRGFPGISDAVAARLDAEIPTRYTWERQPFPSYSLTNLGARIRQAEKRQDDVKARAARTERAEAAGVLIEGAADYVSITFPGKPDREILEALRAAGFHWSRGSWNGYREKIPAAVLALVPA